MASKRCLYVCTISSNTKHTVVAALVFISAPFFCRLFDPCELICLVNVDKGTSLIPLQKNAQVRL